MSPVPARSHQFSPKKAATVKRLKRWRSCPIHPSECTSGRHLVARELAQPGTVWPPRPREHYRMQARPRSQLTRMFCDLVQEQTELGAVGLIVAYDDLVVLSGFSKRTCERAVKEAERLGLVEQWPLFEGRACACLVGGSKCTLRHGERPKLYILGASALIELRRLADARRRPAPRHTVKSFSAKQERPQQSTGNHSVIRDDPIRVVLPEEATEEAQTAVPAESVAAPRPPERLFSVPSDEPSPNDPPLELGNPWAREAAARPPRREGVSPGGRQRSLENLGPCAPQVRLVERSDGADPSGDPLAVMLARLALRFGAPDDGL